MNFTKKSIIVSMASLILLSGCANLEQSGNQNKATGTAGGAALGALAGQLIGKDTKSTLIGAGIGALAGLGWGAYKDKQEQELRERLKYTDVSVSREGDYIKLTLPGGVTFQTNSSNISPSFKEPLNSIASVLTQYPDSKIVVSGFTDNVGSPEYNAQLSQQRALSVSRYLTTRGVASGRLMSTGYGATNFIADNSTPEGRAMNRRVEIKILPPANSQQ
ncbi:MAG: OmpA family protein [Fusobacteriaceae bacterium]|nr:OmpA family protein [Fusobacteriaceae bacterium]